jgi:Rrf2 family protein
MLSQTAEYALRAMVYLAEDGDDRITTQRIAEKAKIPAGYLAKVMQNLARAGLVNAQRGLGGGISLARPAEEISILEILDAVDPIERITACPIDHPGHQDALCPLHRKLDETMAEIRSTFAAARLSEMLGDGTFRQD